MALVSKKRWIGTSRGVAQATQRDNPLHDYEAEPYLRTPRNLGNHRKADRPNDDEDYYYENQLNAPNTWDE